MKIKVTKTDGGGSYSFLIKEDMEVNIGAKDISEAKELALKQFMEFIEVAINSKVNEMLEDCDKTEDYGLCPRCSRRTIIKLEKKITERGTSITKIIRVCECSYKEQLK